MSSRLITTLSHCSGHTESATERCWETSTGSWSLTVEPSTTVPARGMVPVAASSASTSVVLPPLEWPTSATLRIFSGLSAVSNVAVAVLLPAFLFDIRVLSTRWRTRATARIGHCQAFDTQAGSGDKWKPAIVGAHLDTVETDTRPAC